MNVRNFVLAVLPLMLLSFASSSHAQMLTGYSNYTSNDVPVLTEPAQTPLNDNKTGEPTIKVVDEFPEPPKNSIVPTGGPVDFQADNLKHDEKNNVVTASGNVMLVQDGRILRADEIIYDVTNDTVKATGNVVLNEESGDIFYADSVTLKEGMKNGIVTSLQTYLVDGSRFWAESGEREEGVRTSMNDVTFTPCQICEEGQIPAWQIRADKVSHDKEEHSVTYKNAQFDFYGVPVLYTPYFSHPDGTVKQKSGFLPPILQYKSSFGAALKERYYWGISPDQDVTVGLTAYTRQLPMLTTEYRSRWEKAYLKLQASGTYAERDESDAGITVTKDEDFRGHIMGEGLWELNDKWRTGFNMALATDKQYMNQYDMSSEDVLENEIYAERFEDRDYAAFRLLGYQDVRVNGSDVDQPMLLPEVTSSFTSDPDSVPVLGGSWRITGDYLGLRREGEGQDMDRISTAITWDKRLISDMGLKTDVTTSLRGDLYHVNDNSTEEEDSSLTETRVFPYANIETSYPLVKLYQKSQWSIEPLVSLTVSPNLDVDDIPNEDSQDVQIDASNLFEANRFPGYDRIEDQSHITYGLRTGLYGQDGTYGNVFLGQSYRFNEDDNPFPTGSGLTKQDSDIVGQISGSYQNMFDVDYRFQLSHDSLSSQRHEVDTSLDLERFELDASYLFAKALGGTDITESREQVSADAQYYLTTNWRTRIGATQDLGDTSGLREAYLGIDYMGECMSWSLTGERSLTDDSSGDSSTEFMFTIGLKNLGEFEESTYKTGQNQACNMVYP